MERPARTSQTHGICRRNRRSRCCRSPISRTIRSRNYFVDGITSDITTNLSKFSTLFVIASNSSFRYRGQAVKAQDVARDLGVRYLLEGSLQRAGDTLRINVNLIDATTGRQVWAERYERPIANVLVVQKEIAQNIVGVIGSGGGALQRAELERIARIPTERSARVRSLPPWSGIQAAEKPKKTMLLARQMFEKAIQADPNYARAMAECSLTYLIDVFNGWTDHREEWLQMAEELARRAIEIDPFRAVGLCGSWSSSINSKLKMTKPCSCSKKPTL